MMEVFLLSNHAQRRSAQRNLSKDDIDYIVKHGERVHRTGVIFCQLRTKNLPHKTPGNDRSRQLIGTTVVLCKCGRYVVTLYRQEKAFQRDCRKSKYALDREYLSCPGCACSA